MLAGTPRTMRHRYASASLSKWWCWMLCPRVLDNPGPGPQLVMSYAHAMAAALVLVVNYDQGAGAALPSIV